MANSGGAIFHQNYGSSSGYGPILMGHDSIRFYSGTSNGNWNIASQKAMASTAELNSWHHYAYVRNGSNHKLFYDGVVVSEWVQSDLVTSESLEMTIGVYQYPSSGWSYSTGYLSDLRISSIARWTSNFTPPSGSYL